MKYIALIDIGSNTIVLKIYTYTDTTLTTIKHVSIGAHLIQYVDIQRIMSPQGIDILCQTIDHYFKILQDYPKMEIYAIMTEPSRIENFKQVSQQLAGFPLHLFALTGKQEAYYDGIALLNQQSNIEHGLAFDLGGGSTELITIQNHTLQEYISLPLGSVRLMKTPTPQKDCFTLLQKQANTTFFQQAFPTIYGMGGTIKAIGQLQSTSILQKQDILNWYHDLQTYQDQTQIRQWQSMVTKQRYETLVPGLNMILAILEYFHGEKIIICSSSVREGFLLSKLALDPRKTIVT